MMFRVVIVKFMGKLEILIEFPKSHIMPNSNTQNFNQHRSTRTLRRQKIIKNKK